MKGKDDNGVSFGLRVGLTTTKLFVEYGGGGGGGGGEGGGRNGVIFSRRGLSSYEAEHPRI